MARPLLVWLDDDSEGDADTRGFLDRRLADVMRFEKFKAQLKPDPERQFSLTRLLGPAALSRNLSARLCFPLPTSLSY